MAGFVRGGRPNSPDPVLVEPVREVVEVQERDPLVVHVIEPVAISAEGLGLELEDLVDVEVGAPPEGEPLAWQLEGDMFSLLPFTVEGQGLLTRSDLGIPNGIAQLGPDAILRVDQRPPQPVLSHRFVQLVPATRWQIQHDLEFQPAGIRAIDTSGTLIEFDELLYPQPGIVELVFGAPVAGTAWLS